MCNNKKVFIINGQDYAEKLSGYESDVTPESDGWIGSKTLMDAVAEFTEGKNLKDNGTVKNFKKQKKGR